MENQETNLVDVTRLYTLRHYSETFKIPYGTVYSKFNTSSSGRSKDPFTLVYISGTYMIYVSQEEENLLRAKMKGSK